jgi:hypothetical protein
MKDVIYCSNCFKIIRKNEAKWVTRQTISDENILIEEWSMLVCKKCYDKLSKDIKKNVIKQEYVYIEEE